MSDSPYSFFSYPCITAIGKPISVDSILIEDE